MISSTLNERMTARSLETIGINKQDLTLIKLKSLLKLKDVLLYKLAGLKLQTQPLQRQVNQSFSHLSTMLYYIDK